MRTIIIAGGLPPAGESWRRWVQRGDRIIGADGGAALALAWGLRPELVIGDMDSLSGEDRALLEARGCQFVVHPSAKDETDLELALTHAVGEGAEEIIVLAAFGGRFDHALANVLLLTLPWLEGVPVRFVDDEQQVILVRGNGSGTVEGEPGDLVSLLPLGGDASGVRTTGLAWALEGDTLRFGLSRGVSNEMTGREARVEVDKGFLLLVHGPPQTQ